MLCLRDVLSSDCGHTGKEICTSSGELASARRGKRLNAELPPAHRMWRTPHQQDPSPPHLTVWCLCFCLLLSLCTTATDFISLTADATSSCPPLSSAYIVPANAPRLACADLILGQRHRRWTNIWVPQAKRLVLIEVHIIRSLGYGRVYLPRYTLSYPRGQYSCTYAAPTSKQRYDHRKSTQSVGTMSS